MPGIVDFAKQTAQLANAFGRAVTDGWYNTFTGLGTSTDKGSATRYCPPAPMVYEETEALYNFDDIAHTIVGQIVLDAMGAGFKVKRKADGDDQQKKADEQAAKIERRLKELGAYKHITDGRTWARMCGAGGILLALSGAGAFDQPIPLDANGKITKNAKILWLRAVTKKELTPFTYDDKGEPETYTYSPIVIGGAEGVAQLGSIVVHRSRLLMFAGARTAPRGKLANGGWDLSVLDRVWAVMSATNTKWQSVTHMFSDMSQSVFKIKGLISSLTAGDKGVEAVSERVRMLDRYKSVARSIVLDAGRKDEPGEDYSLVERSAMTGLDSLLGKDFLRLCMAARMPATILIGMSPAGLSATGESDLQIWDGQVENERTLELEPHAETLVGLVANELSLDSEGWGLEWPALRTPTDKEKAETTKTKVETAAICVEKLGVLPEEAALALPAMGVDIEIDRAARQEILATKIEELKNPPEPVLPGDPNADPDADPDAPPGDPAEKPAAGAQPTGKPPARPAAKVDPKPE